MLLTQHEQGVEDDVFQWLGPGSLLFFGMVCLIPFGIYALYFRELPNTGRR